MKKITTLFLTFLLLAVFLIPGLSLPAAAKEVTDYIADVEPKVYSTALTAMDDLPEGDTAIAFEDTTVDSAEMRYVLSGLPANGQYHLTFWYKTNADIASLQVSYVGEGKSKPMGYKRIDVTLPNTKDAWKQFDLVFQNTDTVNVDGALYVADTAGNSLGAEYQGMYVRFLQSGTLSEGQATYFTVPSVTPMQADITGKYEAVSYEVKDTNGSGEKLYTVLGIRSDSSKTQKATYNPELAGAEFADLFEPVALEEGEILPRIGENLIKDVDMENLDMTENDAEKEWVPQGGTKNWGALAHVDTEVSHSGNQSIRITPSSEHKSPYVTMEVPAKALTTYQLTAWTRQSGLRVGKRTVYVKFEFYGDMETGGDSYLRMDTQSECFTGQEGGWTQFEQTITTPPGTKCIAIRLRVKDDVGIGWYDDIEFYQVSETPCAQLKTDQVFYYPSAKSGAATLTVNRVDYPDFDAGAATVDYALKLGDEVLYEKKGVPFCDDTASFLYDTALLENMATEYTVEAKVYENGSLLQTLTTDIWKYPRPTAIGEDGNYYNKDGSIFIPVIGYHIPSESALPDKSFASLKEGGINTLQISTTSYTDDMTPLVELLDKLESYGMKAIVCVYVNMKAAGHEDNAAHTAAVVEACAGHEAVFGWAVQDEPAAQIPNYEYYLKESYKLIKKYDTDRPIYICDVLNGYELRNSLYCDLYVDSTYPRSDEEPGNITRGEALMMDTSAGTRLANKPHYHLVQAYEHAAGGFYPNIDEMRNMQYSALLSGARGLGYYKVKGSMLDGRAMYETDLWQDLITFVESGEEALMYDLLTYGGYPVFSAEIARAQQQYKAVLKDGDVYAVLLNGTNKDAAVSMPLTSYNGRASIGGGTASAVFGCKDSDITLSADALSVVLPKSGVAVIRVQGTGVTAEMLAENKFTDLESYPWAKEQIETLGRSGRAHSVINWFGESEFRPGEAITRADFAYFLMNTLNIRYIESETAYTAQFADVDPDAYYAEAIQMGRRVGIFKGDGTNFSPDAPISRQELMAMVARGMLIRYGIDTAKSADLSAFPDNGSISDWAENAVRLIVGNGIVMGNADGTLNPLGNTTRAEAAVIMARIAGSSPEF